MGASSGGKWRWPRLTASRTDWGCLSYQRTKRSSTGSGLPFTSLCPYPPQNFKLKQTAHCPSITSEHQQLFTWVGRQASAIPITSFKTQQRPDRKKSPTGSFQSIFFPGKKSLKHRTASAKKTPGRQFGGWRYPSRWVTHQFLCFVWDRGRFPPSVAEMLQHCSMKEGSVRCGQEGPFGPKEGVAEHLWAPTAVFEGLGSGRAESWGSRPPAGQSALLLLRGGRPGGGTGSLARAETSVAGVLGARSRGTGRGAGSGRGGTPGHLAGVPAPRAEIRLGRPVRTERGATPRRLRGLGPQEVGPWTPELLAAAQHTGRLLSGSPPRGSHLRDDSHSSSGRGGGGGRLARRLGERPGGPGLGPPQPPPLAAGGTRSGCARQGRKLSDLVGKTSKQTAVRRRCPPASARTPSTRPPLVPATGHDLGGPLRGRAAGI